MAIPKNKTETKTQMKPKAKLKAKAVLKKKVTKKKPEAKAKPKSETKGKKLTSKELRFCEEFVIDFNAAAAARRAKYAQRNSRQTGFELMSKPYIQAKIGELSAAISERAGLSADWVVGKLMEIVERGMEGTQMTDMWGVPVKKQVVVEGEKKKLIVWRHDPAAANRALELLGKHLKLFTDKVEHSGAVQGSIVMLPSNGREQLPPGAEVKAKPKAKPKTKSKGKK